MAEAKNKYRVKSQIQHGVIEDGQVVIYNYPPGSEIELTVKEASEKPWCLVDPPTIQEARSEEEEELDELMAEALDSIRRRPDNPDSGVAQPWQTDRVALADLEQQRSVVTRTPLPIRPGFERANAGTSGIKTPLTGRSELNKTEMELEAEEEEAADAKKAPAPKAPEAPKVTATTPSPAPGFPPQPAESKVTEKKVEAKTEAKK